ncbi:uncharacterized protein LOC128879420 isoform X1 [Hylaeus volcanicus]|uniref:uncharacterized protein LOC128879420 isoform X1 n=1 Tax=Hylaeus volcanicus TaxID=313075 RepID=UPI0023B784D4|nr:uncharacterized protein LOC128879420 isoform X1 [Hylaeus volcanicus]
MTLLEEYQEFIERDPANISYLWKLVQIFFYLLSIISGYVCSILFYLIWQQTFSGNCPLWAKSVSMLPVESQLQDTVDNDIMNSDFSDWWNYIITSYNYNYKCIVYFITCFLSCMFGTVWLTLFCICGKGGYDIAIFQAPWRIVPYAMLFNLTFTIITTYATLDLENGYKEFTNDVRNVFLNISNIYEIPRNKSECEIAHIYVETYNIYKHNTCKMLVWLQTFSGMMMWSWIGGAVVLILRIITVVDFRILKIKIYEVPNKNQTEKKE